MDKVIAMILAGGQGSRLSILAEHRAKPAVPFCGIFRIIDFTMSNVMHSNIPIVSILTQYKPYSLMNHLSMGESWGFSGRKHQSKILPPYVGEADSDWYAGTADAVYQNLSFIERFDPDYVLVLSGDHIYNMDYNEMIRFHLEKNADMTLAVQEVPWDDVERFGVSIVDDDQRMTDFVEKKKDAPSNQASLGIYVFNRHFLEDILREDAADKESQHDFGKNIIPKIMKDRRIYCYIFNDYWRDVGTISAYWATHQEALDPSSGLDLDRWKPRTSVDLEDLTNIQPAKITSSAKISNSIISPGCIIEGEVSESILSPGVRVRPGARVEKSVIMDNSDIGGDASVMKSILDKRVQVGKKTRIGVGDSVPNEETPHLLSSGITVIGKKAVVPSGCNVGKNIIIHPLVKETDYDSSGITSGSTIRPVKKDMQKLR